MIVFELSKKTPFMCIPILKAVPVFALFLNIY